MALRNHRGDAPPVAQVTKITPAGPEVGDVFTLKINGKPASYTAKVATVADVTAGLAAAIATAALTVPEWAEVTVADKGTHLELTAATAGVPFTVTATTTNTQSGQVTVVETTKGVEAVNEVQKLELVGTYTGGNFTITWDPGTGDETTGNIAHNASAATVQTALEGLASVSPGDVVVTGGPGPSTPWFVTFKGAYAETDVNPLRVNNVDLVGNGTITIEEVTPGGGLTNEIQSYAITGTAGTYTLTFDGQTTSAIAFDATAATIQSALEALNTIGTGNVAVFGGLTTNGGVNPNRREFTVKFQGTLAGVNVSLLSLAAGGITGGWSSPATIVSGGEASVNELQLVDLGAATGGTFQLTFDGQTTSALAHNAGPEAVQSALEALSNINANDVEVLLGQFTSSTDNGGMYTVIFRGTLANTNVSQLVLASGNLTGATSPGVTTIQPGGGNVDEVQSIKVFASGGTFTLTFDGQTTASIAFGATAATVETELEALSTITNVTVTGSGTATDPYLVTFVDPGDQDVALMTADSGSLTGGSGQSTEVTSAVAGVNEVQTVTIDASVTGGTFTLSFRGAETNAIAFNASAATVETELETLSTIDGVTVAGSAGGPWTVTFDSATLGDEDVELLVADGSNLVGGAGSETITVSETTRSGGPEHFDDPLNWTGARVPESLDDVVFTNGRPCRYGLKQRVTFTADAATDTLTMTSLADFVDDQILRVTNSGGALPAGLAADTNYFVINLDRDAKTLQLSTTSGGSAVNITDAGTGTHTIAAEFNSFEHRMAQDEPIGLPVINESGNYFEYRALDLACGLTGDKAVDLGTLGQDGAGAPRINLDFGAFQFIGTVYDSGQGVDEPAIRIKGTNANNTLKVRDGDVGVATRPGETAAFGPSGLVIEQQGGLLELGDGVTVTGDIEHSEGFTPNEATINGKVRRIS